MPGGKNVIVSGHGERFFTAPKNEFAGRTFRSTPEGAAVKGKAKTQQQLNANPKINFCYSVVLGDSKCVFVKICVDYSWEKQRDFQICARQLPLSDNSNARPAINLSEACVRRKAFV